MIDLRDRLQTALGDAYRIERELGGGGMSRVFVARETALGRQVVVKVLTPAMAATVNADRFRREIQLAAALQHPHIVPLYAAGEADGLLYFTMPLVEGESLQARLAREGQLPVDEAQRILCDVADALAYAHARGVAHRDIKPGNILLSGRHALVSDFGVAKALRSASEGGDLTSIGLALGTPAYMSPEQAAADPHVDHRTDIYAVGVVGYEMLTGRLPFNAPTPQGMLAAHATLPVERPDRYRPAIPAELNALLLRCLEKMPADRIQRADELRAQLQSLSTPSGGSASVAGRTVVSSGTEAALRRSHPVRVGTVFTVAAAAILVVAYLLMERLGLPTWVFVVAAVLVAIGLPGVLLTGVFERKRLAARVAGATDAAPGVQRWFTWRRLLAGGMLAFGGLALAAAVYMGMRLLGIGPAGTLMARGALKSREAILLADFENRTADTTLGPTLTEALRVDLSQSPVVRLLDPQQVMAGLQRMQLPAATVVTGQVARELAQRSGAGAIVTGEVSPVGRGFVLSANVVSAGDGSVLTAVRENAADDDALVAALDRLSHRLRERIGESLTSLRASAPLEQVTTGSLEALRRYSEAIRQFNRGEYDAALSQLRQAVVLDTGFAMAWRKLAATLTVTGGSKEEVIAAASRAYQLSDRLPEVERGIAAGTYFSLVQWDPIRAVAAYQAALELDPGNEVAAGNLSVEFLRERRYAAAESLLFRLIPRNNLAYFNLVAVQAAMGRYQDAHASLAQGLAGGPGNPVGAQMAIVLAFSQHDFAAAESLGMEALKQNVPSVLRENVSILLAAVAVTQGKLAQGRRDAHEATTLAASRNAATDYLRLSLAEAWTSLEYEGRPREALALVDSALARYPLDSLPVSERPYSDLAQIYAAAGRPAEGERLLDEYARAVPEGQRTGLDSWSYDYEQYLARAAIAVARDRLHEAIPLLRVYHDSSGCNPCGLYELARVYDRLDQPDSARAIYLRYVEAPGFGRIATDPTHLGPAYHRLGELYEAQGDRANALTYYGKLADLWQEADPVLQPVVRETRNRMSRLAGEQ